MKIRQEEVIIDQENPFLNCKFQREKFADPLTNIISTYSDGFVLAINNEWGTGKTTFVKMWQQYLMNQNYKTLYFNAWENDFDNNPLVALMAELKSLQNINNTPIFKSLIKKGAIITKHVLPGLIKAVASRYIGEEAIQEAIKNLSEAATEILNDEINEYCAKKKGLLEFKNKFEKFIEKVEGNKPVVFIIDELDRCRPNYAVEVLEQVKHFFAVKGIVFVLSIDKIQLGNAIRGVYGSELINSDEYLRRFIDLEYKIESPDYMQASKYFFDYFDLELFFSNKERLQYDELKGDKDLLLKIASITFADAKLNLRQIEKIFAHFRVVLNVFKSNQFVFPGLLIILVFTKNFHPSLYADIKHKRIDLNDLLDEFSKVIPKGIDKYDLNYFTYLEANLVYMYYNSLRSNVQFSLFEKNEKGEEIATIKSRINLENNYFFYQQLKSFVNNWNMNDTQIDYLISKIDFTNSIKV